MLFRCSPSRSRCFHAAVVSPEIYLLPWSLFHQKFGYWIIEHNKNLRDIFIYLLVFPFYPRSFLSKNVGWKAERSKVLPITKTINKDERQVFFCFMWHGDSPLLQGRLRTWNRVCVFKDEGTPLKGCNLVSEPDDHRFHKMSRRCSRLLLDTPLPAQVNIYYEVEMKSVTKQIRFLNISSPLCRKTNACCPSGFRKLFPISKFGLGWLVHCNLEDLKAHKTRTTKRHIQHGPVRVVCVFSSPVFFAFLSLSDR